MEFEITRTAPHIQIILEKAFWKNKTLAILVLPILPLFTAYKEYIFFLNKHKQENNKFKNIEYYLYKLKLYKIFIYEYKNKYEVILNFKEEKYKFINNII